MDRTYTIHITEGWFRLAVVLGPTILFSIVYVTMYNLDKSWWRQQRAALLGISVFFTMLILVGIVGGIALIVWIIKGFTAG